MLVVLFHRLAEVWAGNEHLRALEGGALEKCTLRAGMAAVLSFVLALLLGPRLIAWLRPRFAEPIKSPSETINRLHRAKQSTPTMGGLFIVAGLIGATIAFGDLSNGYLAVAIFTVLGLAAIGAIDDRTKVRTTARGITPRAKLLGQTLVATVAACLTYRLHCNTPDALSFALPGVGPLFSLGWIFIPLAVVTIVAASNAVNVADGLDGLAGGCLVFALGAMGAITFSSGHAGWAHYLNVPHVAGAGEVLVVAAAALGALLGFLWFNCHPASVFMGDTGSLPLGGLLGLMAVFARQELLFIVVAGVFVVEAASVLVQVAAYRWTGRRVFLCAPLHHHFQFKGWPESKIVVRFWIAGSLCAILGLAGLKLAPRDSSGVTTVRLSGREQPARAVAHP